MKVLNLYACLGGNRLLWENCHVTAVELDPYLAELYQKRFPNDDVIVTDAHQYLLENYLKFDFIWTSPPCPTHSKLRRFNTGTNPRKRMPTYPDMKLYEEIIFLQHFFKGKYCVENVIPFYEPLIPAQKRDRHLYWCNFLLPKQLSNNKLGINLAKAKIENLSIYHKYDFSQYKGNQRIDKIARNLVDFEAGKSIFDAAIGIIKKSNINQTELTF